jgi:sortase A
MLAGILALLDGTLYQAIQKRQFADQFNGGNEGGDDQRRAISIAAPQLFSQVFSKPDPLVMGELQIPRLGLDVVIREGVDSATLRRAVGHLPSSVRPGERGNSVVLGHRDTFFRPLRRIARGDTIRVRTFGKSVSYKVELIQVTEPGWTAALAETDEPVVTLITCFPFEYIGSAPHRFIVRARLAP